MSKTFGLRATTTTLILLATIGNIYSLILRPNLANDAAAANPRKSRQGFSDIISGISSLYNQQVDNIRQYQECRSQYSVNIQGVVGCFSLLFGGNNPEHPQQQDSSHQIDTAGMASNSPIVVSKEQQYFQQQQQKYGPGYALPTSALHSQRQAVLEDGPEPEYYSGQPGFGPQGQRQRLRFLGQGPSFHQEFVRGQSEISRSPQLQVQPGANAGYEFIGHPRDSRYPSGLPDHTSPSQLVEIGSIYAPLPYIPEQFQKN